MALIDVAGDVVGNDAADVASGMKQAQPFDFSAVISGLTSFGISALASGIEGEMARGEKAQQLVNLVSEKYNDLMTPGERGQIMDYYNKTFTLQKKSATETENQKGMLGTGLAEQRTFQPLKTSQEQTIFNYNLQNTLKARQFSENQKQQLLNTIPNLNSSQAADALIAYKKIGGTVDPDLTHAFSQNTNRFEFPWDKQSGKDKLSQAGINI